MDFRRQVAILLLTEYLVLLPWQYFYCNLGGTNAPIRGSSQSLEKYQRLFQTLGLEPKSKALIPGRSYSLNVSVTHNSCRPLYIHGSGVLKESIHHFLQKAAAENDRVEKDYLFHQVLACKKCRNHIKVCLRESSSAILEQSQ